MDECLMRYPDGVYPENGEWNLSMSGHMKLFGDYV